MLNPPFYLKNRHLQTLYPTLFEKPKKPLFSQEEFILHDGDFLDIYYHDKSLLQRSNTVVILLHGLGGSYKSPYIQRMLLFLKSHGIASLVMHYRGSSGRPNRTPQSYHSGKTDDLKEFLESLKKRYTKKKIITIGYSLGANILLKFLGEEKEQTLIDKAVAISTPFDLAKTAQNLNTGFSKIYQAYLLRDLKKMVLQKYAYHDMEQIMGISKQEFAKISTFYEFDHYYTAKVHGFHSVHDYYTSQSSLQYLPNIQTQTLIIHAQDDPFMQPNILQRVSLPQEVSLDIQKYGGHVGFISKEKFWLEKRVLEFL